MSRAWTKNEEEKLKEMYENDIPDIEIAKHLKRTKHAINLKRNRLGITDPGKRRFPKNSLNSIRESRKKYRRENHPCWKGGKRKTHSGYIEVLIPNHHRARGNGYVFEHIIIAEEKIGRKLREDEVVHHINEIKTDNRKENLQVISKSRHSTHHGYLKRTGKYINCVVCGKSFYRKPSQVKRARCCSLYCVGKYTKMKREGVFEWV